MSRSSRLIIYLGLKEFAIIVTNTEHYSMDITFFEYVIYLYYPRKYLTDNAVFVIPMSNHF